VDFNHRLNMNHKFRKPGYHPLRKLKIILSGIYFAVVSDFSVAYKVILSVPYQDLNQPLPAVLKPIVE
jgi:hypothetical protein